MQYHFLECRPFSKILSDVGTNSVSEKFEEFCKWRGTCHAVSSSYNNDQSNKLPEACIEFKKKTWKNTMKLMLTYIWLCYRLDKHW